MYEEGGKYKQQFNKQKELLNSSIKKGLERVFTLSVYKSY